MQPTRLLVASPIEPSGASWLLNCFLELDIRIDHKPVADRVWRGSTPPPEPDRIWTATGGHRWALNPKAGVLKKFLPALTRRTEFRFRDDVVVQYVQDLPPRRLDERARVLMVRDPRDAFYSSYRRDAPALTFAEFLRLPNPATLLGRAAHWALFVAAWLATPDIHVVRFEDYKGNAEATLRAALATLGLAYADGDIAEAVRLSSFERAREAELALRRDRPGDRQVANRSGTVGEARDRPEVRAAIPEIEVETAAVLGELGYAAETQMPPDPFAAARLSAAFLGFFDTVRLPRAVTSAPLDMIACENNLFVLLAFAHRLHAGLLARAGMPPADARTLLDSLAEFTRRHAEWLVDRTSATRSTFDDGSGYFFERIKTMRQSGRPGPGMPPHDAVTRPRSGA